MVLTDRVQDLFAKLQSCAQRIRLITISVRGSESGCLSFATAANVSFQERMEHQDSIKWKQSTPIQNRKNLFQLPYNKHPTEASFAKLRVLPRFEHPAKCYDRHNPSSYEKGSAQHTNTPHVTLTSVFGCASLGET